MAAVTSVISICFQVLYLHWLQAVQSATFAERERSRFKRVLYIKALHGTTNYDYVTITTSSHAGWQQSNIKMQRRSRRFRYCNNMTGTCRDSIWHVFQSQRLLHPMDMRVHWMVWWVWKLCDSYAVTFKSERVLIDVFDRAFHRQHQMRAYISEESCSIHPEVFHRNVESMPRCIETVLSVCGGQITKTLNVGFSLNSSPICIYSNHWNHHWIDLLWFKLSEMLFKAASHLIKYICDHTICCTWPIKVIVKTWICSLDFIYLKKNNAYNKMLSIWCYKNVLLMQFLEQSPDFIKCNRLECCSEKIEQGLSTHCL